MPHQTADEGRGRFTGRQAKEVVGDGQVVGGNKAPRLYELQQQEWSRSRLQREGAHRQTKGVSGRR